MRRWCGIFNAAGFGRNLCKCSLLLMRVHVCVLVELYLMKGILSISVKEHFVYLMTIVLSYPGESIFDELCPKLLR